MAVRGFAGSDSLILLPGALVGATPGPWTAAVLFKRNMTGASPLITVAANASNGTASFASKFWAYVAASTANDPVAAFVNSTTSTVAGVFDVTNADGWCILVVTKASGAVAPRFHLRKLGAATTTRGNGTTALANGAVITSADRIELGKDEYFNKFSGSIALVGLWSVALTDAQVDELWAHLATSDWMSNSGGAPAFAHRPAAPRDRRSRRRSPCCACTARAPVYRRR